MLRISRRGQFRLEQRNGISGNPDQDREAVPDKPAANPHAHPHRDKPVDDAENETLGNAEKRPARAAYVDAMGNRAGQRIHANESGESYTERDRHLDQGECDAPKHRHNSRFLAALGMTPGVGTARV